MRHITFVKKILANGYLCKKCQEVSDRMRSEGILAMINHVVIADARDADSPGMQLANKYQVERAPFFVVEEDGEVQIFDIFFKFKKYLADISPEPIDSTQPKLNTSNTTL
ncbi:MAG: hypothetical protein ACI9LY_003963 [Arenicella sp.]|jgi:hypothetical protein